MPGLRIPVVPDAVSAALKTFLSQVRRLLMSKFYGVPDPIDRVVSFRDLVRLGLISEQEAQKNARN